MGKKNVLYVNQLEGLLPFEVFTSDVTTMTMTTMTYDLVLGTWYLVLVAGIPL